MSQLIIHFEGYWQCRQATDPDPSDAPRGVSGYTFALGYESDLDTFIRLQRDEIKDEDFRESDRPENIGVFVTQVKLTPENDAWEVSQDKLNGAKVRFLRDPKFELRNEIIYHELEGIIMPICPFIIQIKGDGWCLQREDPLDPHDPSRQVWQMTKGYEDRSPRAFTAISDEVLEAIKVPPSPSFAVASNDYFQKRKDWLILKLTKTTDPVLREAYKTRIWAIDFFSEDQRLPSRLGLQAIWDFKIRGSDAIVTGVEPVFHGTIDPIESWSTHFWMGGFDGDLMRGYMRGDLAVPFTFNQ